MSLELNLRIAGALLLVLAASHVFFPKQLGWREDLAKLTLLNRQVFLVHVGFIMLILVLFGLLALGFAADLVAPSRLAAAVLGGLTLFWGLRLITQQFIYDPRSLARQPPQHHPPHSRHAALVLSDRRLRLGLVATAPAFLTGKRILGLMLDGKRAVWPFRVVRPQNE